MYQLMLRMRLIPPSGVFEPQRKKKNIQLCVKNDRKRREESLMRLKWKRIGQRLCQNGPGFKSHWQQSFLFFTQNQTVNFSCLKVEPKFDSGLNPHDFNPSGYLLFEFDIGGRIGS